MKNHLGTYECRLCLTLHTNEGTLFFLDISYFNICNYLGSYLAHT